MDKNFEDSGLEAGFSKEQLEFMWDFLAKDPHTHTMDDIDGLEEALEGEEDEEED